MLILVLEKFNYLIPTFPLLSRLLAFFFNVFFRDNPLLVHSFVTKFLILVLKTLISETCGVHSQWTTQSWHMPEALYITSNIVWYLYSGFYVFQTINIHKLLCKNHMGDEWNWSLKLRLSLLEIRASTLPFLSFK